MGADLGFFAEDRERDFPELNKCPDCETFFADANCPICGKECPEEFRAGNRKPIKQKKRRRTGNGRVQFVPWYHSTWFIILMMVIFPLAGIILAWSGPWKKNWKIISTVIVLFFYLFGGILGGLLGNLIFGWMEPELPVNTAITEEEYRARCEAVDVEALYRHSNNMVGKYVRLTVEIVHVNASIDVYEPTTYICKTEKDGKTWEFIILDYRTDSNAVNLVKGDTVTFWGEVYTTDTMYWDGGSLKAPWIACLYADLIS